MSKSREEYLAVCNTCQKRAFDKKLGVVCSLTNQHASYEEDQCPDFELDEVAVNRNQRIETHKSEMMDRGSATGSKPFEFERQASKGGVWGGVAIMIVGAMWLAATLFLGIENYYGLFLIVIGLGLVLYKTLNKSTAEIEKSKDKDDFEVT